jgi:hypothetical protein
MPPRSWRVRIEDILDAIDNIEHYVAGLDFDAFDADRKTVDAVDKRICLRSHHCCTRFLDKICACGSAIRRWSTGTLVSRGELS